MKTSKCSFLIDDILADDNPTSGNTCYFNNTGRCRISQQAIGHSKYSDDRSLVKESVGSSDRFWMFGNDSYVYSHHMEVNLNRNYGTTLFRTGNGLPSYKTTSTASDSIGDPPLRSGCHVRPARRRRTAFSNLQLELLEHQFRCQKYLSVSDRCQLARALHLNDTQVKTWYQNRRTKWKRETPEAVRINDLRNCHTLERTTADMRAFRGTDATLNLIPNIHGLSDNFRNYYSLC